MARSTFNGPILSGDVRFGPQRNVGYTRLSQTAGLTLTNTTVGTAGYAGGSGQFVSSNGIQNNNGSILTPGTTVAYTTPTADSATAIYRGVVFWIPTGCHLDNIFLDTIVVPTVTGTLTAITPYISNTFATSAGIYATSAALSAVGRTTATYTATQYPDAISTLADVPNIYGQDPSSMTQIVVTLAITGTALSAITAGQVQVTISYTQPDNNIGNLTTYPYGNFD
jgi:hypothetical protein